MEYPVEVRQRDTTGAQRLAWLLDDVIRIPGTSIRFGLDPLMGLIPGGGDLAGGVLSAYIILAASRAGAPSAVLVHMAANVILDTIIGSVPLLGDLFDAGWKANTRNVTMLQEYVNEPHPVQRRSRAVLAAVLIAVAVAVTGAAVLSILLVRSLLGLF